MVGRIEGRLHASEWCESALGGRWDSDGNPSTGRRSTGRDGGEDGEVNHGTGTPLQPRTAVDVVCWAWVVVFGSILVWWNLDAGQVLGAKIVGILMVAGAVVSVVDAVRTLSGRGGRA